MNRRGFIVGGAALAALAAVPAVPAVAAPRIRIFWFHQMSDEDVAINWLWVATHQGVDHSAARALHDEMERRAAAGALRHAALMAA